MAAYTDYSISKSRLGLLRGQERSIIQQIKAYKEKLGHLEQVDTFVSWSDQLGLRSEQWDRFLVDLKEVPVSYEALDNIISQTRNTAHYFFRPLTLSIKTGAPDPEGESPRVRKNKYEQVKSAMESVDPGAVEKPASGVDATITLDGRFLVKRRGSG